MKRTFLLFFATLLGCGILAMGARAQTQPPCCSITSIDAKTGIVSAKINTTGATFQFKVNDAKQLTTLRVGQSVYANLGAKQISLDGKSVAGAIVSIPPALKRLPGSSSASRNPSSGSAPAGNSNTSSGSSSSASPGSGATTASIYSAASLANVPLPQTMLVGGNAACKQNYTSGASLLDVLVSGCDLLSPMVNPTQPDTSDPTAPRFGGGGPYRLLASGSAASGPRVTNCGGADRSTVAFGACLKAAAYSAARLSEAIPNSTALQQFLAPLQNGH